MLALKLLRGIAVLYGGSSRSCKDQNQRVKKINTLPSAFGFDDQLGGVAIWLERVEHDCRYH
ncbi:hypothetical protein M7I_5864 [Glarea lozoyensis 74030]|uniref:Uncharacterized protein n=1 Tax=Glarea lozoyensis (strain ATCC 74030 / MF5533) TaxID=1104152 RepID=H0ET11_GLAL7|nr:hypothetical protein M7I_5864 [Glarea lozoyensis 74030]